MPKIDEGTINYAVYENDKELIGMAEVTLPDLTSITQTISGAGIAGNVEVVYPGNFDAMSMTLNFRTIQSAAIELAEPRRHNIALRAAQQIEDTVTGTISVQAVKHELVVQSKKFGGGKVAPNSPADASGEYVVHYWAMYIDGEKQLEIDPFNFICVINGEDSLADVRTALGK